jgi:hypothetical protein
MAKSHIRLTAGNREPRAPLYRYSRVLDLGWDRTDLLLVPNKYYFCRAFRAAAMYSLHSTQSFSKISI